MGKIPDRSDGSLTAVKKHEGIRTKVREPRFGHFKNTAKGGLCQGISRCFCAAITEILAGALNRVKSGGPQLHGGPGKAEKLHLNCGKGRPVEYALGTTRQGLEPRMGGPKPPVLPITPPGIWRESPLRILYIIAWRNGRFNPFARARVSGSESDMNTDGMLYFLLMAVGFIYLVTGSPWVLIGAFGALFYWAFIKK